MEKKNSSIFRQWWFYLIIILFVIGVLLNKSENTSENKAENIAEKESLKFFLIEGELGDYGVEVVLNEGTEFEEYEIAYFIPNGIYQVSNADNRGVQISVYSGLPVKVNGWDEFVMDNNCPRPIVLMPGQNKELEIKEGQFIVLSDGSSNIFFTKI